MRTLETKKVHAPQVGGGKTYETYGKGMESGGKRYENRILPESALKAAQVYEEERECMKKRGKNDGGRAECCFGGGKTEGKEREKV